MKNPFSGITYTTEVRLGIFLLILCVIIFGPYLIFYNPNGQAPSTLFSLPIFATSDKEIVRGDTTKQQVIFTFDGGDGTQSADQILNVLVKHHIKGTFFLTGKFIEKNPDLVKRIVAEGNEVFNHTFDHPHLTQLSDEQIMTELADNEAILLSTASTSPHPYFRAPYGDRDRRVLQAAFKAGYESVYWTIDARDWEESTGETAAQVHDNIISNLAPGNIYLMHIGDTITGSILDEVFTEIENRGYKIVSLTQGL